MPDHFRVGGWAIRMMEMCIMLCAASYTTIDVDEVSNFTSHIIRVCLVNHTLHQCHSITAFCEYRHRLFYFSSHQSVVCVCSIIAKVVFTQRTKWIKYMRMNWRTLTIYSIHLDHPSEILTLAVAIDLLIRRRIHHINIHPYQQQINSTGLKCSNKSIL